MSIDYAIVNHITFGPIIAVHRGLWWGIHYMITLLVDKQVLSILCTRNLGLIFRDPSGTRKISFTPQPANAEE